MKKLLRFLADYKKECVLGPLFKMLEATFELLVPFVVRSMIDDGIGCNDTGHIIRMCLLMALLAAVGLTSTLFAQYFAAKAAAGFSAKLRQALMQHIQRMTYTDLDTLGTSSLVTRMTSDVNQVQTGVNLTIRLLLRSPFIVFGAMVSAFMIDVRAALIFVAAIPLLSVVVFGVMLITIPMHKKVQEHLDTVTEITRENLDGVRVIRAFRNEDAEAAGFRRENDALAAVQKAVGRISAVMNPATYVIVNLAVIGLLSIGAIRVDAGLLTQGSVIALYNLMSQILVELIKFANLIISITKAAACENPGFVFDDINREGLLRFGKSWAFGTELMLRYDFDRLGGWLSYTWSRAMYDIPELNGGKPYRSPLNHEHAVNFVLSYDFSKRVALSTDWVFYSGAPTTFPNGRFAYGGTYTSIYSERNEDSMPNYHRMDLSLTLKSKRRAEGKPWGSEWNFSFYNAYSRHNAWSMAFLYNKREDRPQAMKVYLFTIIPSVSFNVYF